MGGGPLGPQGVPGVATGAGAALVGATAAGRMPEHVPLRGSCGDMGPKCGSGCQRCHSSGSGAAPEDMLHAPTVGYCSGTTPSQIDLLA